jgi:hypothetical protein
MARRLLMDINFEDGFQTNRNGRPTESVCNKTTVILHDLNKKGASLSSGLKILHAKGNNRRLHVGVGAFVLI